MSKDNSDRMFTICGSMSEVTRQIAAYALKQRLPLMTCFAKAVAEDGGLFDYDTDRSGTGATHGWIRRPNPKGSEAL